MMNRHILKSSIIIGLLLMLAGCNSVIYDQEINDNNWRPKVYLKVSRGTSAQFRSSPNEPDAPSINTDTYDYEDWVHHLTMMVFDTPSGNLIASHFDDNSAGNKISESFIIELTGGQRDFYFVANMPASDMSSITNRTDMDSYLKTPIQLDTDLYHRATAAKAFPMARVYLNQTVDAENGGSVYNPVPFRPNNEDVVLLRRAVAHLQVEITGNEIEAVKEIRYKNAFRDFSLVSFDSPLTSPNYYTDATGIKLKKDVRVTDKNIYNYYMPEALIEGASWTAADHKPINYFEIETEEGTVYEIPIITFEGALSSANYLSFATGAVPGSAPDYNIYRNRRYVYKVNNLQDIEIEYEIDPWTEVKTTLFMGYGYNVIIDKDGNITIENTIDDCMPHKVTLKALNGAYFGTPGNDTIEYGYLSASDTEYSLEKTKAGYSESFGILNNESVGDNQPYLEIYYNLDGEGNPISVKTYTK